MEFVNEPVAAAYRRCISRFKDSGYAEDDSISVHEVLRAHYLIADYFVSEGQGIGGIGPRDDDLLESAVFRQFTAYGGYEKWSSTFERCATLMYGIIKDHPFHDANKRTALLVCLYHLIKNNRVPTIKQREIEDFVVEVADDGLTRHKRFKAMSAESEWDLEVRFIADFLRRNTRKIDRRSYTITYQDLQRILNTRFNAALENPQKNFIDVVRIVEKRGFLGLGPRERRSVRAAHVGFPGWKNQVSPSVIREVRKALGLMPEFGVDSAAFFGGADPLNILIESYSGPLRRLADR